MASSTSQGRSLKDLVKGMHIWKVIHATTRDGSQFENVETLFESEPGPWTFNHAMTYNPDAKEFLLLKLKMDNSGFQYTAFFSPDGRNWKEHSRNPLFLRWRRDKPLLEPGAQAAHFGVQEPSIARGKNIFPIMVELRGVCFRSAPVVTGGSGSRPIPWRTCGTGAGDGSLCRISC